MFKPILDLLSQHYSGERAMRHVEEIVRFHRIQASPGLRAAATYCHDFLAAQGLHSEILRFPGDGKTFYWADRMPQEWDCSAAELRLVSPTDKACLLADFAESKMAVIQRSVPTPPDGIEAEVVVLDDGTEEEHYAGLDVTGKVVLTKGTLRRVYDLAVERRGAVGIIFDGMRETPPVRPPLDLAEARQYTSFWWQPQDKRCFGFVLSPRQGEELRRVVKGSKQNGQPVRVRAKIESRFTDGFIEATWAAIAGQTDEEILVLAHLCHPQWSANDNASGVGAVLEAARVLQELIRDGSLPKPRRTISFLLPPEIAGTYAYLASDEGRIPRTLAAINLDMVGENQDICGSTLLVVGLPGAFPSPVDALAVTIQEALAMDRKPYGGLGSFSGVRYAYVPFSGGSDHYILCDPTVGIACPMLNQWPDRFYHTSFDTIDKVDAGSLRLAGLLAATYAYFLANAGGEEAAWLAREAQVRYRGQIARTAQDTISDVAARWASVPSPSQGERSGQGGMGEHSPLTPALSPLGRGDAPPLTPALSPLGRGGKTAPDERAAGVAGDVERLKRRLLYLADRQIAALGWLERLGGAAIGGVLRALQSEASTLAWSEHTAVCDVVQGMATRAGLPPLPRAPERVLDEWEKAAAEIVPLRRYRGPISLRDYVPLLSPEKQDAWHKLITAHKKTPEDILGLALYWADGRRNLLEIADLVELETGVRDMEYLVEYMRLLKELELIG